MDPSVKVVVIIEKINNRDEQLFIDNDITNINVVSNDGRVISLQGITADSQSTYDLFETGSNIISNYDAEQFINNNKIKNKLKKKIKETIEELKNCIVFSCRGRRVILSQKKMQTE